MSDAVLHLSPRLPLPLEAVTEKLGLLGRTGSGKTYAALKLAEEMDRAHAQFVVLDPVGKWWSLRLAADGVKPGISIPVFGGLHGDIPLEPTSGKLVADVVCDRAVSLVIDVSQFESDAEKCRFAEAFATRFFYRKKALPSAVHLFLEEAQEFIPQNPQREEGRMLHAFTRIWKLGRNFGIGGSLLSQRPQEINKKVLNQTELLLCFQITGPQERKAIDGWIAEKGIDADIAAELPKLARGHAHAWSPAWLNVSKVVSIGTRWTFDASSTPKVGARANTTELAPIDLEKLRADMAATIERAKAEDPKELRKRILTLERDVRDARAGAAADPEAINQAVARAVVETTAQLDRARDADLQLIEELLEELAAAPLARAGLLVGSLQAQVSSFRAHPLLPVGTPALPAAGRLAPAVPVRKYVPERTVDEAPRQNGTAAASALSMRGKSRGEHVVLRAVAQYRDGVSREQLSLLTGYARSTRDKYLQQLRAAGHVVGEAMITATDAGLAHLGDAAEPLPTGTALADYWLARLPEGERVLLAVLIEHHPAGLSRQALSDRTSYARSTRDKYLQHLRARRLVDFAPGGDVHAAPLLFD